jgi:hypothetical protein
MNQLPMTAARIRRIAIAALEIACLALWLAVIFAITIWTA